jgi:hypothetical protein
MKNKILTEDISGEIFKQAAINSRLIDENVAVTIDELFLDDSKIPFLIESFLGNNHSKNDAIFFMNLLSEFMSVQVFKTEIFKLMNEI